jgi:hypothetical protein
LSSGAEDGAADYAEIMIRRAIAAICWLASARATGWSFVSAQGEKIPRLKSAKRTGMLQRRLAGF